MEKKQTKRKKKDTPLADLNTLGNALVSHLDRIGASWDDFCRFLDPSKDDLLIDTKRLRDFIAAYHELSRALSDIQGESTEQKGSSPVVILPEILKDE